VGEPLGDLVGDGLGLRVGLGVRVVTRSECVFLRLDQSQWIGQPLPYL